MIKNILTALSSVLILLILTLIFPLVGIIIPTTLIGINKKIKGLELKLFYILLIIGIYFIAGAGTIIFFIVIYIIPLLFYYLLEKQNNITMITKTQIMTIVPFIIIMLFFYFGGRELLLEEFTKSMEIMKEKNLLGKIENDMYSGFKSFILYFPFIIYLFLYTISYVTLAINQKKVGKVINFYWIFPFIIFVILGITLNLEKEKFIVFVYISQIGFIHVALNRLYFKLIKKVKKKFIVILIFILLMNISPIIFFLYGVAISFKYNNKFDEMEEKLWK